MFSGNLLGCQSFLSPYKHVEGTTQHQFQQEDKRFDGSSKQRVKYAVFLEIFARPPRWSLELKQTNKKLKTWNCIIGVFKKIFFCSVASVQTTVSHLRVSLMGWPCTGDLKRQFDNSQPGCGCVSASMEILWCATPVRFLGREQKKKGGRKKPHAQEKSFMLSFLYT